ncbi:hypothetical protein [Sphingobium sp. YG1]|uniref:hypothetical protein n=1 Tax=Sphingobium sp. YG1 TaxID=2082188 RepID=UPI000DBB893C|nr:hypothetical protein [Sphingobium sp. YG1]BBC99121.1 hypothetical protein YGS_C1P0377 [Sphingobium sp. YG1]
MTDPFTAQSLRLTPEPPIATATSEASLHFLTGPALRLVIAERMEQIEQHGYLPDGDLMYDQAELALAGKSYVDTYIDLALYPEKSPRARHDIPDSWPWQHDFWKEPGLDDQTKALTKGIALLLAELDRHLAAMAIIHAARPLHTPE